MMRLTIVLAAIVAVSCGGSSRPVAVDPKSDVCAFCRMAVSDPYLAAQIAAPGEVPVFFDDIGCLAGYLKTNRITSRRSVFVADHRTGAWVPAASALFSRTKNRSTPMASGVIAHADDPSRLADPDAADGVRVPATELFGELP